MHCNKLISRAIVFACMYGMALCVMVGIALTTRELLSLLLSVGGCGLFTMLMVNEIWFAIDVERIKRGALAAGLSKDKVL